MEVKSERTVMATKSTAEILTSALCSQFKWVSDIMKHNAEIYWKVDRTDSREIRGYFGRSKNTTLTYPHLLS